MSIEDYFSDWKARTWTCPRCSWAGNGADTGTELFAELFEVKCPECDARLATIPLPTQDSIRVAADAGNAEAQGMLGLANQAEEFAAEQKASRRKLRKLKAVPGEHLEFTLDSIDTGDGMNPSHIALLCNGTPIYKEPSGYEHWEAIIKIGEALIAQYGNRVAWFDPGKAGVGLLGDNLRADSVIQEFLQANGIAPPTGAWAKRKENTHD